MTSAPISYNSWPSFSPEFASIAQGLKRMFDDPSVYVQEHIASPVNDLEDTSSLDASTKEAPIQRLQTYLRGLVESGDLSNETALLSWKAWNDLRRTTSYLLPVPDACPGPDGQLLYSWDTSEHHFELEIYPEGLSVFFYRNRVTGRIWGVDHVIGQPIPREVIEKLGLF